MDIMEPKENYLDGNQSHLEHFEEDGGVIKVSPNAEVIWYLGWEILCFVIFLVLAIYSSVHIWINRKLSVRCPKT